MRHHMGNIWTFETAAFRVTVDAYVEDDLDLSWDDTGEVRAKLENGGFIAFQVRARCVHKPTGMETEDWLGGCIYEDLEDFRGHIGINRKSREESERLGREVRFGSDFSDMVRIVVRDMRDTVADAQAITLRAA